MPLADEEVVLVEVPAATMVKVRVPLDPDPSLATAFTVTVPVVVPALNNPVESMVPFPETDHVTGTFAVS
jgi:hypothetical protein